MTALDSMVLFGETSWAQQLFKMFKTEEPWTWEDGDTIDPLAMQRMSLVNLRLRVVDVTMIPFRQITHLNLSFNRLTEIFGLSHLKSCESFATFPIGTLGNHETPLCSR